MIISLDTETTGIDFAHGAKPFLVTWCEVGQNPQYYEWPVNPLTRQPEIPDEEYDDLLALTELIDAADVIYLQNAKFDVRALATIGIALPWEKVRDTLVMGHLLATNHKHDLTSMCIEYLGTDIEPFEVHIKQVVQQCRALAKRHHLGWRLATEGLEDMPSIKPGSKRDEDKPWKNDMWLPRAMYHNHVSSNGHMPYERNPQWLDACAKYACGDSEHTLYLGLEMERLIRERGLWKIYEHRLEMPRVDCEMESYGVTVIGEYTKATIQSYSEYIAEANAALIAIAAEFDHELELADGASINDNMRDFFYGKVAQRCSNPRCNWTKRIKHWNNERPTLSLCPKCSTGNSRRSAVRSPLELDVQPNLNLRVIVSSKSGNASLDKYAMQDYLMSAEGPAHDFIRILTDKRKHDTDLTYMQAYQRFWVPIPSSPGYYRLHPSLNPCGTDHLRQSSSNPNLQNVGGQEDKCDECDGKGGDCIWCHGTGLVRTSVKECFGPAPGREWWALDYKSIERRIPAYESGEPKMIEVFEKPEEPPYWGSLYLLTASVLFPKEFWPLAEEKNGFKEKEPRLYKRAKFFDLATQYGAGRAKADDVSGVKGSFDLVKQEFPLLTALQRKYLRDAERLGYVQTLPDRTVDPERGYPILPSRTEEGRVLSTTPFNYHTSGTACWCKNTALVRCSRKLAEWRAEGFDAHMSLEIHDEILFDFPRGATLEENLPRALELKRLMEESGQNLVPSIPTPVSVKYHSVSWAKGVIV